MKNLITLLFILTSLSGVSQKIDYTNFDNDLATKALAEAFLNFRDTIDSYGHGKKWTEFHPEVDSLSHINKPRWSDWVYETFSLPNCEKMAKDGNNVPYHVDVKDYFRSNIDLVRKEYYEGTNAPQNYKENSRLSYSENAISFNGKRDTYQDLANEMILCWEGSTYHRNAQRGLFFDTFGYSEYGLEIQDMFACSVIYNPQTGLTKAVINFIE